MTAQRLLRPGDRVIDYSDARPDPAEIVRGGARGVVRYSAGAASSPHSPSHAAVRPKLITPREFAALRAAGLDVIANDEWYATRVTEGADAGRRDADAAAALWHSCGLARGAALYVSWDAAPAPAQWAGVVAYLDGYAAELGERYALGVYAGTPFLVHALENGAAEFGWRPDANDWSNDGLPFRPKTRRPRQRRALAQRALLASPAHLYQNGNTWFGRGADENLVIRTPLGSHCDAQAAHHHRPKPPPRPKPHPHDVEAGKLISPSGRYVFEVSDTPGFRLKDRQEHKTVIEVQP